jgi:hypothetical protein
VHDSDNQLTVEPAQICFFRDQLRSARAVALADAEGFHAVLRVVELIAQQLGRNIRGLGYLQDRAFRFGVRLSIGC